MFLRGAIVLALGALLIYGLVKGYPLLRGPELALESPVDGASAEGGFILVRGTAHRSETLTLNGAPLLMDKEGHFSKELPLPRGGAILSLTAHDRFGREITVERSVFVP
ncbi:MAG: hypothetical protein ABA06_02345 [Parcubacteria bacterium C7867-001]|nr:MAG: hypothetical protein ABA06_02345 [Parcubacteria bacterium C7867-001]